MPFLKNTLLGFDLPTGTTFKRAHEIAEFLNNNLDEVNVTIFDSHPNFKK